jgi:hypothetical protein
VRLTSRGSLIAAGVLVVAVLAAIGGLLIVQAIRPHISVEEATAAAIGQIQQMNTGSSGYTLVSARYDLTPDRVYDDRGNLTFSESRSACLVGGLRLPSFLCHAAAAWILHLRAPAQGGYRSYDAWVVVDATTGRVRSASVGGS